MAGSDGLARHVRAAVLGVVLVASVIVCTFLAASRAPNQAYSGSRFEYQLSLLQGSALNQTQAEKLQQQITEAKLQVDEIQLQVDRAHAFFEKTTQKLLASAGLTKKQKLALTDEAKADFYRRKAVECQSQAKIESDLVLKALNATTMVGGSYSLNDANLATSHSAKATRLISEARKNWNMYHKYTRAQLQLQEFGAGGEDEGEVAMEHKFAKHALHEALHRLLLANDKLAELQHLAKRS